MTDTEGRVTSRINIAFTEAAEAAAIRLLDQFPLESRIGVARVGVAYALRCGLPLTKPADLGPANGSNFNVGSVDPQGELRDLLLALHPDIDEDPYNVVQTLMSVGTLALDQKVADGEILTLRDLIETDPR